VEELQGKSAGNLNPSLRLSPRSPTDLKAGSEFSISGEPDTRPVSTQRRFQNLRLKGSPIAICRQPQIVNSGNFFREGLHFARGLGLLHTLALGTE